MFVSGNTVHKVQNIAKSDEALQAVNVDLCKELAELKLENESLNTCEEQMAKKREKKYLMHCNTSKKLQQREKALATQQVDISEKARAIEHLHHKITNLEPQIEHFRQEKKRIQHRARYWKQKCEDLKSMHKTQQVQEMVEQQRKIAQLEQDNLHLRDTVNEITSSTDIVTFEHGKYTDDIRTCCYELLSLNVGIRNVVPVIKAVLENLMEKIFDRLPSKALLCNMIVECLTLAQAQVGEGLSGEDKHNFTIQTDGTSKYAALQYVRCCNSRTTYTLGLRQVFSGSSQTTLDTLKEILDDLDVVQRELGCGDVAQRTVVKLKKLMSDRHAAEKLFNQMLAEYRAEILPEVYSGWSEFSEEDKDQLIRMNDFYCGLHFLVALADSAEATLVMWESIDGGNVASSSGTGWMFFTFPYLPLTEIQNVPLASFRGNRFNMVFHDAAGVLLEITHGRLLEALPWPIESSSSSCFI